MQMPTINPVEIRIDAIPPSRPAFCGGKRMKFKDR
jgi:hypothetical protein